jgi:hypothetical protein
MIENETHVTGMFSQRFKAISLQIPNFYSFIQATRDLKILKKNLKNLLIFYQKLLLTNKVPD